jgi:DNA-binding CsgD family transcriptional regulator
MSGPLAVPHPWTEKLKAQARERDDIVLPLLREGLTQRTIAARTGLTRRGVKAAVGRLRTRGLLPALPRKVSPARAAACAEVLRLTLAGMTALAAAKELGRNEEAVKLMRRELRLQGRLA